MSDLAINDKTNVANVFPEREFDSETGTSTDRIAVGNVLAEMEKALNDIVSDNPRIGGEEEAGTVRLIDGPRWREAAGGGHGKFRPEPNDQRRISCS